MNRSEPFPDLRKRLDRAAAHYAESTPNPYVGRETRYLMTMAANGLNSELRFVVADAREDLLRVADRLANTRDLAGTVDPEPWRSDGVKLEKAIRAFVSAHDTHDAEEAAS